MNNTKLVKKSLDRRNRKEKIFHFFGVTSVIIALAFLVILLSDITIKALPAFTQTELTLEVTFDNEKLAINDVTDIEQIRNADFRTLYRDALLTKFPDVKSRNEKKELYSLLSNDAEFRLQKLLLADPSLIGKTQKIAFLADDEVDGILKGSLDIEDEKSIQRIGAKKIEWIKNLENQGLISRSFNWTFFSNSDSREPELAGIKGALVGSIYTLFITLILSFPLAVATAIYLEKFAPRNRLIDFIEININNLAAVPSIVFGMLGLAVFINFFELPRSAPIVGGLVLALMTLPTIIIASRSAIKAVPPSISDAALGLGASKMQTIFHHVLPAALPGILTGTIIGMAQALGETAPLLMIGMVAFIADVPQSMADPATVLPVQVFLWADSPERGFMEKTSAAILVLLVFLILMNLAAILLRKKFEKNN
jgi:phosphate transport system permease protein